MHCVLTAHPASPGGAGFAYIPVSGGLHIYVNRGVLV